MSSLLGVLAEAVGAGNSDRIIGTERELNDVNFEVLIFETV